MLGQMRWAWVLVVVAGCMATAGPTVAYRPRSGELAVGWNVQLLSGEDVDSGNELMGGITAGQTFGTQSPGHDTFIAARAAFGTKILWKTFQQGFYGSADLGLSLHDWAPGVYAGAAPIWVRSMYDRRGGDHYVVALRLGVRHVAGGNEIYLAPDVGVLMGPILGD
jgi:hypothetical protein